MCRKFNFRLESSTNHFNSQVEHIHSNRPKVPQMPKKWIPLESNPDVLNEYIAKLGVTGPYKFCDIFGLDEGLLAMVPQPVKALVMCFPISETTDAAAKQEDDKIAQSGQAVPKELFYLKQTIGNACGTIAVLHSLCNNANDLELAQDGFISEFIAATASMDAAARGKYLEDPPAGAPDIEAAHQAAAAEGDTAPPPADEDINLHFVAFVHKDGVLWELDGRRQGPVPHGPTSPDTLLADAAAVIQAAISRTPSLNFSLVALAAADS